MLEEFYNKKTQILEIPRLYNKDLVDVPLSTKKIIFLDIQRDYMIYGYGSIFNKQIMPDILPNGLISLTFGVSYNREILPNVLPNTLISLTFGDCYNKEIKVNVLPVNLISLTFGESYNKIIKENVLPLKLTKIIFSGSTKNEETINNLPSTIKEIKLFNLEFNFRNLPVIIQKIILERDIIFDPEEHKIPFGCDLIFE